MKYLILGIVMAALLPLSQPKKTKIVFFGDSITQMGVGPTGYITRMDSIIKQQGYSDKVTLEGAGIGGNKVYDLYLRMEKDVIAKNPDIVVIYIGINDVWHKTGAGTGTDLPKYKQFYTAIINRLKEKNIKIMLCTPTVIGERNDNSNQQDGDLNYYSSAIKALAAENNLPLCDLRDIFIKYLEKNNPQNLEKGVLTTDKVHLNNKGDLLVAQSMWEVLKKNLIP